MIAQGAAKALAVFNTGSDRVATHPFHLSLKKAGIIGPITATELWTGKKMTLTEGMPLLLKSHDVLMVRMDGPGTGKQSSAIGSHL